MRQYPHIDSALFCSDQTPNPRKLSYNMRMKPLSNNIDTILIDLDGVLYIGTQMIPGADRVLQTLRHRRFKIAGITNTTTQPRHAVADKLAGMGIALTEKEIYTPAILAKQAIGKHTARLFIRDALRDDFTGIQEDYQRPDYIVMGDMGGEGYEPETLCDIFRLLMQGAKLLALHKNRFWQKPDGLHLDLGAFVSAVEYASGQKATVLGKPSKDFFQHVCHNLNSTAGQSCMIGDDIESDIGGAQAAGLTGILVQTGKYRPDFTQKSPIQPNYSIPSIASFPELLPG